MVPLDAESWKECVDETRSVAHAIDAVTAREPIAAADAIAARDVTPHVPASTTRLGEVFDVALDSATGLGAVAHAFTAATQFRTATRFEKGDLLEILGCLHGGGHFNDALPIWCRLSVDSAHRRNINPRIGVARPFRDQVLGSNTRSRRQKRKQCGRQRPDGEESWPFAESCYHGPFSRAWFVKHDLSNRCLGTSLKPLFGIPIPDD